MKLSTVIVLLFFAITLIPSNVLNRNSVASINRKKAEGYVAFIANDKENIDNNTDNVVEKCECNGTKQIIHGDGHRTPCNCVNSGSECKCKPSSSINHTSGESIMYYYSSKDPCSSRFVNNELSQLSLLNDCVDTIIPVDVETIETSKRPQQVPSFSKSSGL